MTKKDPAEIAGLVNEWLERFMPLITPLGILAGFLFPRIFIRLRPLVPLLFGVMTLSGSLKLKLREFGETIKSPLGIGLFFLSSHILTPLAVFLAARPIFGGDQDTIAGYILLYSVPTAVSGFIWISLFRGDRAFSLTLVLLDTVLAPLLVPGTMAVLQGARVSLDMSGIALSLILMVVCPTVLGVGINEASRGRIPARICPYLNPLAKICLTAVIAANASPVAAIIRIDDPQVWLIGGFCVVFTAAGYVLAHISGILGRLPPEKRITLFFSGGLRNISAATTIAIDFFPGAAALPCLLGIVSQQVMAAIMGRLFWGKQQKKDQ
jgi:predicted Na+-dependent transporter